MVPQNRLEQAALGAEQGVERGERTPERATTSAQVVAA